MSRELPRNREAEQIVLGGALIEAETVMPQVMERLRPRSFYFHAHRQIFQACVDLFEANDPIDPVLVGNELDERGVLPEIGGRAYLSEVVSSVTTTTSIAYYAQIIERKAILRSTIEAGEEIVELGYAQSEKTDAVLDQVEQKLFAIADRPQGASYEALSQLVGPRLDELAELGECADGVTGVPSGYRDLDRRTAGWQDEDLIVVAGRPSMGKTALACSMIYRMAVEQSRRVGVFSVEMGQKDVIDRLMAFGAGVDLHALRSGRLNDQAEAWRRVTETSAQLSGAIIYVDDTPAIPIFQLKSRARRMAREAGLDILFIDYLQLIEGTESGADNRAGEVAYIARALKGLARELEIPIVLVSQLSRALERRPEKRPILSDLRESGEIEQTADAVLFVYRDDYYNTESTNGSEVSETEIILAKQRNGPTGTVILGFHHEWAGFVELTGDRPEPPF